ncbi:hypothetical protein quinque_001718 [Culex quinquefasciatus]
MLMGQFTETRAMIDGLRNDINTKIDAVKSDLEEKLNDVKLDINSLKVECTTKFATNDAALKSINDRLGSVSQNVGALEFRNELIISGIPFQSGENLYAYLQEIYTPASAAHDSHIIGLGPNGIRAEEDAKRPQKGAFCVEFSLDGRSIARSKWQSASIAVGHCDQRRIGWASGHRPKSLSNVVPTAFRRSGEWKTFITSGRRSRVPASRI